MQGDRYITMKLVSGEEIVSHLVHEDDYEIRVLFPMIVKLVPRMTSVGPVEQLVLAPYTYMSADDEFTFNKHQIIVLKDLDPNREDDYNRAIDDFIETTSAMKKPHDPEEVKKLTDKLQKMFGDYLSSDEDLEELPSITVDSSKTIH